ncbi:MAG: DNA-directed RNA polymerase I subunit rpa49 [Sclerophora amabilis]|nr:MAG: DNA-directed RNA polymerase I subunit rpa49 [Sclerophora amabilis]
MAESKRKRSSLKSDHPNKKVAIETPHAAPAVKVSFISEKDEWSPIVGLAIAPAVPFKPYRKARSNAPPRSRARQPSSLYSTELLLHSNSHPKIDYLAREEEGGGSDSLLKHYVGVYDPKTGALEVMQARSVTIRGTLRPDEEEVAEEKEKQTNQVQRQELGLAFGTRKAQKMIASRTENAISTPKKQSGRAGSPSAANGEAAGSSPTPLSDPAAAAMLQSIADSTKDMATREELQAATDEKKPRPAANLEALNPEDVYSVETLVGEEELRVLQVKEWLSAVEEQEAITTKSLYVSRRIQKIAASGDVKKLKVLRYLLLLLEFHSCLKSSRSKSEKKVPQRDDLRKVLEVSDFLIESVLRRFSDRKVILTKWHLDNLITHIAALSLHIDDGFGPLGVDFHDLREDLRLETRDLTRYFQEVGCKVTTLTEADKNRLAISSKAEAAQHRIARLTLPVTFPALKRGRRKV